MTEVIACADCLHFQPDANNPTAAMGRCLHAARHGYFFAGEKHRCKNHEPKPGEAIDPQP